MTAQEEQDMHELAVKLERLTRGSGWPAMQYFAIGNVLSQLTTYCATCDCQAERNRHTTVTMKRVG